MGGTCGTVNVSLVDFGVTCDTVNVSLVVFRVTCGTVNVSWGFSVPLSHFAQNQVEMAWWAWAQRFYGATNVGERELEFFWCHYCANSVSRFVGLSKTFQVFQNVEVRRIWLVWSVWVRRTSRSRDICRELAGEFYILSLLGMDSPRSFDLINLVFARNTNK
jgi:hypothetical protein